MTIPILIYQMDVQFGDPQSNLGKIKSLLENEQPKAGTLLVLPELFLTGYEKSAIADLTATKISKEFEELCYLTHKYEIQLFGSIPIQDNGKPYNTAIYLKDGELVGSYKKSHLFGPMGEKELFEAGRQVNVIEPDNLPIGMSICYDLRFPELYKKQQEMGVALLLICAEWPIQRIRHWDALLRARAIENQCVIIACNRVGDDPDYHYGGHSGIYNSYGEIEIIAKNDNEEILRFDLDTNKLTEFRNNFDTKIDRWI